MEDRKLLILVLAGVLLVFGSVFVIIFGASLFAQWAPVMIEDTQQETKETSGEVKDCSRIVIDIQQGSASSATVAQTMGEKPAGNISVTWFYQDSRPVQRYAEITTARGVVKVQSGASGRLDQIRATPLDCEGAANAVYSP